MILIPVFVNRANIFAKANSKIKWNDWQNKNEKEVGLGYEEWNDIHETEKPEKI